MDEGYSKSGLATMEDVQEWLMQGLEMVVSRDEVFTQEMEALNAKKCELVEAQQAREKKLKAVKENLVMLENVRREKEIEVMKFHQVFASLPKNLLQAMASKSKDMVTPAGDSHGVKRKWMDFDQLHEERKEEMNQPSTPINKVLPRSQPQFSHDSKHLFGSRDQTRLLFTQGTPTNRVLPPRSQPQFSHDSYNLKRTLGESQHMVKSGDQSSTPINKVLAKSQSELSYDSYIMKRKLVESKHKLGSGDQPSTPINKELSRSQSQLSHDSYIMKSKLMDLRQLYSSSGDQRRQPSTPINKVLPQLPHNDSYSMKRRWAHSKQPLDSTPNDKVLPRQQVGPHLSHDVSHTMKTKLDEWENRQFSSLTNQVLSHDCNSQSLSSDLDIGGMVQESGQQYMEMSHKFKKMRQGLKGTKQEVKEPILSDWRKVLEKARNSVADEAFWLAQSRRQDARLADIASLGRKEIVRRPIEAEPRRVQGENTFYSAGVRNQADKPTIRRACHEEARAPIRDCSPSLSKSKPADRTPPASRQNIQYESTSAPHPQRSTSLGLVLQDNVTSVRVTSSSYHLKSILKKK